MDDGRLHIVIDGEASQLKRVFEQIADGFKKTQDEAEKTGRAIDKSFSGLSITLDGIQRKLTGFLTIGGITAFVSKVKQTREYFQDIESAMEVFLGSAEKASKFTSQLKDYAWYNTFEFDELAAASKQLLAYGNDVNTVIPIIDKLSNVATATKQPLMELVQIYNKSKNIGFLDMRTTQQWASRGLVLTDVLKEMGETVNGTKITFEQLDKALDHVTQEGGMFAGIMEQMMPNLSMSWGQLQDDLTLMWNGIGEALQGPIKDGIELLDKIVANYKDYVKWIGALVAVYGTYRAALLVTAAVEKANLATKGLTIAAEKAEYMWLLLCEKAQKKLNATIMKNPYVLAATALATFISAIVLLQKQTKTASELVEESQDIIKEYDDSGKTISSLIARHDKLTASVEKTKGEIEDLQKAESLSADQRKKLTDLTAKYNDETTKLAETARKIIDIVPDAVDGVDAVTGRIKASTEAARKFNEETKQAVRNAASLQLEQNQKKLADLRKRQNELQFTLNNTTRTRTLDPWVDQDGRYHEGKTQVISITQEEKERASKEYFELLGDISKLEEVNTELERRITGFYDDLNNFNNLVAGKSKTELEQIKAALADALNDPSFKKGVIKFGDLFTFDFQSRELVSTALEGLGGNAASGDELSDKKKAAAYRRRETMAKNRQSVQRQEIDMEFSLEEERLNAMEESAAKQLALAELNHRREMEQLKRQREDKLKQLQDNERAVWLAGDPDRKEYNFKSSITEASAVFEPYIQLFAEQQAQIDRNYEQRRRDILQQEEETARAWQQKESDIRDRLEQAQIDAMDEGFDKEQRQRALNNKRELEALENEKREYVKQVLTNAKAVFDAQEQAKKALNPDYQIQLFDPSKYTVDTSLFDNLIAQIGTNQADELLNSLVSSYETYENRKKAIIDRGEKEAILLEKAGFAEQAKNRRKAMKQELNDLDRQNKEVYKLLEKDQKKWGIVDFERAIAKARTELNALLTDPETNAELISLWKNFIEQAEAATRDFSPQGILAALLKPNEGKNGLKDRINALKEAWNDMSADQKWENIGNYVTGIASGFQKAAEYLQEIAELTGDSGLADTAQELSAAAQNLAAAGQGAASGGWIGAIVGGVVDIIGQTVEAFANVAKQEAIAAANARDYRTEIEKLAIAINDADFDSVFGEMSIAKGRAYAKNAGDSVALFEKKLEELNKKYNNQQYWHWKDTDKFTGYDLFLPILGSIIYRGSQMDVEANDWRAYQDAIDKGYEGIQRMLVKTKAQTGWAKFWGAQDEYTSLGDLAPELWENGELNVEAAKAFLETNTQITEEQRKQIENLIELKEGYDAAMEQIDGVISDNFGNLSSALTDVIWDSVVNGSKDAFAKMEDIGSEHIAKLGKQLISEMLMSEYLEQYREQMRAAYKLGSASETQSAIRDIVGNIFGGMQQMLDTGSVVAEEYKQWALEHGFDLSDVDSTRKGAAKSGVTATQDSVDEWNARTTTIQGHTYEIKEEVKVARQQRVEMLKMFSTLLNHVQGIHKDTSSIASKTDDIKKDVSGLRVDVGRILNNGITIKR